MAGTWMPFRCRVKAGRAVNDPEKLVTPGVMYATRGSPDLTVRLVALGWWDWHISLLLAWRTGARRTETTGSAHESAVGETDASDAALINDIFDKMAEVVAPLPGIPDAPGDERHD